jgi:hypothetical protein
MIKIIFLTFLEAYADISNTGPHPSYKLESNYGKILNASCAHPAKLSIPASS